MDDKQAEAGETARHLLTPAAAAEYLGVSEKAMENWRGTGSGPTFIKLSPKCIRYNRDDLDAHIWANRKRSTAEA